MRFETLDPDFIRHARAGGLDANGQAPEQAVSTGPGHPCRACLRNIDKGEAMLVLAARPFPELHPYAEVGPVFLHAGTCASWADGGVPEVLTTSPQYLIKAYGADHRIVYGTGEVVAVDALEQGVADRLSRPDVSFVDVRSARNNCFLTRARQA